MKTLKFLAMTFCSLFLAIGMLSIVAFFYNYHTLSVRSDAGAFVGAYDSGSFVSNMAEGFGWNLMDEKGFNNEKFIRHPDVLIMGPSHIFCEQLPKNQNVTYLLNHRLEGQTVYNTGMSGNFIESCVAYLDETCSYYQPATVVLATHTLFPDEQAMQDDVAGIRHQSAYISDKGHLVRAIRKYIPATGLMLINLRNWRNFTAPTNRGGGKTQEAADAGYDEAYLKHRDEFFAYASDVAAKHGTKLIVLYYPMEYHLEKDGSLVFTDSDDEYEKFQKMCASHGITVVSTKARNIEMFEESRVLPNGFVNSNVGYGHFNRYGHEAMADVLYHALTETEAR